MFEHTHTPPPAGVGEKGLEGRGGAGKREGGKGGRERGEREINTCTDELCVSGQTC